MFWDRAIHGNRHIFATEKEAARSGALSERLTNHNSSGGWIQVVGSQHWSISYTYLSFRNTTRVSNMEDFHVVLIFMLTNVG